MPRRYTALTCALADETRATPITKPMSTLFIDYGAAHIWSEGGVSISCGNNRTGRNASFRCDQTPSSITPKD